MLASSHGSLRIACEQVISASARLPLPQGGTAARVTARTDDRVADEVYVPPGSGALVREQVGGTAGPGGIYLVTDAGAGIMFG